MAGRDCRGGRVGVCSGLLLLSRVLFLSDMKVARMLPDFSASCHLKTNSDRPSFKTPLCFPFWLQVSRSRRKHFSRRGRNDMFCLHWPPIVVLLSPRPSLTKRSITFVFLPQLSTMSEIHAVTQGDRCQWPASLQKRRRSLSVGEDAPEMIFWWLGAEGLVFLDRFPPSSSASEVLRR